ncbi:DUF2845 domain-containing protein [Methylobacter sp.]|uniref:DUF2845 domain-containing protein n=1 Tax=Methylobacter sp. TaxID=2051955 RepID=UPI002FDECFCB
MKISATWVLVLSLCCIDAAFAMRCGQKLVEPGYRKSDVIARCGQPDSIETHSKIVGRTMNYPYGTLYLQEYEEVQVEEWIYNFGSLRFKQYLRFENGRLKEIKSLGRGY